MWGIEFYDESAKSRRVSKTLSPRKVDSASSKKQEETSNFDEEEVKDTESQAPLASETQPALETPIAASVDVSPQSVETAGGSEQDRPQSDSESSQDASIVDHVMVTVAEDPTKETNAHHVTVKQRSSQNASTEDHVMVTVAEAPTKVTNAHHVTVKQRISSLEEDYVIIDHKENSENIETPKPGDNLNKAFSVTSMRPVALCNLFRSHKTCADKWLEFEKPD